MSFDWNLSSDEENGFENWGKGNWEDSQVSAAATGSVARGGRNSPVDGNNDDSSSSDDEGAPQSSHFGGLIFSTNEVEGDDDDGDNVDWEDAGATDLPIATETPELAADKDAIHNALKNLQPVTLDWTSDNVAIQEKGQKRVARKQYRFEHLTPDLQYLLSHLEKTHILTLTAHAMYMSRKCSEMESLHLAHSLIPMAWTKDPCLAPSLEELRSFCNFFFQLTHPDQHDSRPIVHPYRRRRHYKSKQTDNSGGTCSAMTRNSTIQYRMSNYCAHIAQRQLDTDATTLNENSFNGHDRIQLMIAMTRSLGWRVRYVMALEPCKKDLDVHHPLFVAMNAKNVFQRLWKLGTRKRQARDDSDDKKRPAKRAKSKVSSSNGTTEQQTSSAEDNETCPLNATSANAGIRPGLVCWVEILCQTHTTEPKKNNGSKSKFQWIHVDPCRRLIDTPQAVELALYENATELGTSSSKTLKKRPIPYALAAEHLGDGDGTTQLRLVDVTPRYASSFVETLKARGIIRGKQGPLKDRDRTDHWWASTLKSVNASTGSHVRREKFQADAIPVPEDQSEVEDRKPAAVNFHAHRDVDEAEEKQLHESRQKEPIPTSKAGFKTNPVYTLASLLNANEVLKPDARKRVCGVFKGEFVYRRSDVETALVATKWLYRGRKVKDCERNKPIKRVKARQKVQTSTSFQALKSYGVGQANDGSEETKERILEAASQPLPVNDGMENLYASWQTQPWSPTPVGPNDPIPANEHNNIELALLNPGLVHIDERHVAKVAKQLGIPYVPCLIGFEGHRGNRTPTIRGIVVHQHNEELLREAHEVMASHFLQEEHENRQNAILLRWKRLMVGLLTKERLDRAYG